MQTEDLDGDSISAQFQVLWGGVPASLKLCPSLGFLGVGGSSCLGEVAEWHEGWPCVCGERGKKLVSESSWVRDPKDPSRCKPLLYF